MPLIHTLGHPLSVKISDIQYFPYPSIFLPTIFLLSGSRLMRTSNTYFSMTIVMAVVLLLLGMLTLLFSATAYSHLRTAMSGVSTDSFALRIFATGMLDVASANGKFFFRQLETRIFMGLGFGFLLAFSGVALLLLPKQKLKEK